MINQVALRDALLALAEQHKTQYVMFSALLNEVAALRETVRGLDPTFSEVLEDRRKQSQENTRAVVSQTLQHLNHLIKRLEDGEVC